jgi:hypothetical protein
MQVVGGERDLAVAGAIGAHLPQQQIGGVGEDELFTGGLGLFDSVMVDALGERAVTFHDQPADGEQVAGQAVVLDFGARCGDDVADDGGDQLPATLVPDGGIALVDLAEGVGDAAGLLDQPGVVRAQCGERVEVGAELVEFGGQINAARVEDVDILPKPSQWALPGPRRAAAVTTASPFGSMAMSEPGQSTWLLTRKARPLPERVSAQRKTWRLSS